MIISILFILSVIVAILNDLLMVIRIFNILRVIRIVLTSCFVSCQDIYFCTADSQDIHQENYIQEAPDCFPDKCQDLN